MKTNSFKSIFLLNLIGSIVTACAYILERYTHLDSSDGAYKIGLFKSLLDPFVITIALTVAVPVAVIASPILYFFLRHKNLKIAYPTIQLLTIMSIFAIRNDNYKIIGACTTMIISAIVFWAVPVAMSENKTMNNQEDTPDQKTDR
jgi:dipeptide/tripeptide permease